MLQKIFPFLTWLPLAKKYWKDDLIAGITGTIIVIPQAVAFAMIAGMPPVYGFYTAMLTPVIAAIFGSSYHLVSGPTTTSSIVLYAIISKFVTPSSDLEAFVSLAILLSFMAGVIKLFMGIAKMGKLVNFVSNSVIIGFSAGAGTLIAFKQLKHIFGIKVPQGSSFLHIITYIAKHIEETNWYAFTVAMATLAIALIIRKIKKISKLYMLFAMILGSFIAIWLGGMQHGIETVGKIPSNLPPFNPPDFDLQKMKMLSNGAVILAILGLVEAVAISRSIALNTHQKLNTNQEFVAQGISNVVSSFFSCYTSSASFTRSSINYQAGAKTPMSAIISAVGLMLVVLLFADYASYLPKPAMGGIILLVGYNLIDFKHIKIIFKASKRELIVFGVTLLGTLFLELEEALVAGIFMALFFYLERTSKPNIAELGVNEEKKFVNLIRDKKAKACSQLKIVRIDGSIYFGAIDAISNFFIKLYEEKDEAKHLLIIANGINFIDLAGAEWLTSEVLKWRERGGDVYFVGMKLVAQDVLKKGGFIKQIGYDHFFKDKKTAITEIHKRIDSFCETPVFKECKTK